MASPPPASEATSPPSTSFTVPNPRKRSSISTTISNSKHRKASFAGSAASSGHPLRQTSFPPELGPAIGDSRQSSFSPSVVSQGRSSVTGPNRRGRKPKARAAEDVKSTSGSARNRDGRTATNAGAEEDEDDDEEDADAAQNTILEGGERHMTESAKRLEREHMLMLLNAFDPDQFERYEIWRRVRLKKETVRRIVNQTLSQSVPASVVTTVMTSTKIFIGELVEAARTVQGEWAASAVILPSGNRNTRWERALDEAIGKTGNGHGRRDSTDRVKVKQELDRDDVTMQDASDKIAEERRFRVSEYDKGPLLPEHLREGLRRYKKDREGGSVGFQGMSLHGIDGTASRTGGRKLFR